jgi:hypothetical protein
MLLSGILGFEGFVWLFRTYMRWQCIEQLTRFGLSGTPTLPLYHLDPRLEIPDATFHMQLHQYPQVRLKDTGYASQSRESPVDHSIL